MELRLDSRVLFALVPVLLDTIAPLEAQIPLPMSADPIMCIVLRVASNRHPFPKDIIRLGVLLPPEHTN